MKIKQFIKLARFSFSKYPFAKTENLVHVYRKLASFHVDVKNSCMTYLTKFVISI